MPKAVTPSLWLLVSFSLFPFALLVSNALVLGDEETSCPLSAEERARLIQRHNELSLRIKGLRRQGANLDAHEGLRELLVLYRKLYPVAEFPTGHVHVVLCYRDLCRLSEQLGKYGELQKYSQEGLAMCRRLFSAEEFPYGHVLTARMLANYANACTLQGRPAEARVHLLESIEMSENLGRHGETTLSPETATDLRLLVAAAFAQEGKDLQSLHHTTLALQQCQTLPDKGAYIDRLQLSARCFLAHGQALMSVGDYQHATQAIEQAHRHSLRVFLTTRSEVSHLALIDAHIELGILYRLKSDFPQAKRHLLRALEEIEGDDDYSNRAFRSLSRVRTQLSWIAQIERTDPVSFFGIQRSKHRRDLKPTSSGNRNRQLDHIHRLLCFSIVNEWQGDSLIAENALRKACLTARTFSESSDADDSHPIAIWTDLYAGRFYRNLGRYRDAYCQFAEALSAAKRLYPRRAYPDGHPLFATVKHYVATQLWLLGDTESAAALYREAVSMNERLYPDEHYPRGHRQLMAAYSAWGSVLERDGDFVGAAEYFGKAHRIALAQYPEAEYPHGHDELASLWRALGRLERAQGRFESARVYFQRALESYQQRSMPTASQERLLVALTLSELGRTHCAAGEHGHAENYLRQSLAVRQRLFAPADYPHGHPSLATAWRDLGIAYLAATRYEDSLLAFEESVQMEQAVAESFVGGGSEALLLNLAARQFQSLDFLLTAWCHCDRPAADAYGYVWQRRGFVPRLIAHRHRTLRHVADTISRADREAYLDLRRELSRALLISASQDGLEDATSLEKIRQLNARKEDLEVRLTRQMVPFDTESTVKRPISSQLADFLPPGAVLVDYVEYRAGTDRMAFPAPQNDQEAHLLAFVAARDEPIGCVRLGDAREISDLATRWRAAVVNGHGMDYGDTLRQLVWDPVSQLFPEGTRTVYIAPDGELCMIPWNALPLPDNAGLLIERFAIATVPHGQFLLETMSHAATVDKELGQVMVVGDLDYGRPAAATGGRPWGLKQAVWKPLRGSGRELKELVAEAGQRSCVRLTGSDATTDAVIQLLPHCRWAHFATHGFYVDDSLHQALQLAASLGDGHQLTQNRSRASVLQRSPFVRSGLALSGANELGRLDKFGTPLEVRGILTAESVAAVDCSGLELAVLSACESGRGDVVHGDGVFGIPMAFHVAGARNVISSLWRIDDAATADLMSVFYRLLWAEKLTPLEALRGAQLEMLRSGRVGPPKTRGPKLTKTVPLPQLPTSTTRSAPPGLQNWAAFVLSGPGF